MPLIERYIFRRTAQIFLLTLGALIGTLWVTQALRELDVVTAQGQAIWVFLVMTALALPALAQVIAPVAFLVAVIVTLNNLTSDSELPVISAAGASRKAVNRPVLALGILVMVAVAISYHVLAPASLSTLRALLSRVRADVIATLVQDGGFRTVADGLTMHIRDKTADGGFSDIFVSDDRNADESLQYSAARGVLLERAGGSFLVLQDGDLIREDRIQDERNVVAFDTYALDLSQIGAPSAAAIYKAKERSTFYLMEPEADDPFAAEHPERVAAELHERIAAPFYTLVFALVPLAFLGRPRTSRQDRTYAIAATVLICLIVRGAGFAAVAIARGSAAAIPFMYLAPLAGIGFGLYAVGRDARLRMPRPVERVWDWAIARATRLARRFAPQAEFARSDGT
jgi:lipopolysaccharide export system permease protein